MDTAGRGYLARLLRWHPRLVLAQAVTAVALWSARGRQRRDLLELDDGRLADLGLTRCDAEREGRKPFWRA